MLLRDLRFDVSEIVLRSPQQLAPSKDPDNCYEKDLSIHIIPENIADKFSFGRDSSANGLIQAQTRINCSGVYYLNPTVPAGASNFSYSNRNGSSYESQNGLILSRFMLTDIRSVLRSGKKTKRQDSRGAIFAAPGNISLAGQQNPTCGTMAFFDATRGMGNLHEINTLRRVEAFGTAVAKRFRVVGSRHALTAFNFHYHYYDD